MYCMHSGEEPYCLSYLLIIWCDCRNVGERVHFVSPKVQLKPICRTKKKFKVHVFPLLQMNVRSLKIMKVMLVASEPPSHTQAPPDVCVCRSPDHHRSCCSGRSSEHVPADALLQRAERSQEQSQPDGQQRQPESSAQLRHGRHRQQGRLLPMLEVQEVSLL